MSRRYRFLQSSVGGRVPGWHRTGKPCSAIHERQILVRFGDGYHILRPTVTIHSSRVEAQRWLVLNLDSIKLRLRRNTMIGEKGT